MHIIFSLLLCKKLFITIKKYKLFLKNVTALNVKRKRASESWRLVYDFP